MPDTGLLSPGWAGTDGTVPLSDEAWVQAMLDVEVALARAQADLGVIPRAAAESIARAAHVERMDMTALVAGVHETANPVVALVPQLVRAVSEVDPVAADYVHRGGTSQDILDSATMLICARSLTALSADLRRTAAALAGWVTEHRDTPMVGRTLTQHAVPTTFGLKAAGWLHLVLDIEERVDHLLHNRLPASLGGAAGTLSAYAEYASLAGQGTDERGIELIAPFAAHLGLTAPLVPWHAIRTPLADLASVLTFTATALGKFAADVQVLTRTEIGELVEPGGDGRGRSSAMPQKRNPVLATMITTAARQVPPYALVLFQSVAAEDERSAGGWHAEWQPLRECLRLVLGAARNAAELATGLEIRPDAMMHNLGRTGGAVVTERVSAVVTPLLGKQRAKRLLGAATATAERTGEPLATVLDKALTEAGSPLPTNTLADLLDPLNYAGAAGPLADRVLARYRAGAADTTRAC
ncbi:class-II fumarase/aspartase family protein [Actinocrispum wychmicini]|uniref:3-carboxy-cis,cis-muconate cycloisomerase n=1 Tax=Actinocrispum wychmicini TaxID=1213861 RepID=A0A4R2JPC6_9PSEU|nr:adenylosuccinate lyase family protein [Actinocrispum wychmicini]TCO62003.1 3-carboxy-cis,cis-muconate cycloisomerase [Actinocrispum wychmicini]